MDEFDKKNTNFSDGQSPENRNGVVFDENGTYHGVNRTDEQTSREQNTDSYARYGSSAESERRQAYSSAYGTFDRGNGQYYNSYNRPNGAGQTTAQPPREKKYAYPPKNEKTEKPKKNRGAIVFAIITGALCLFLTVVLGVIVVTDLLSADGPVNVVEPDNYEEIVTLPSDESGIINTEGQMSPKGIYNKVLPSSVGILVYANSKTLASEGTGVLFKESDDGKYTYIITCAHVISGNNGYIRVQLSDGSEYSAETVGFDARTDIGVIRIEASGLELAEIGDSSKLFVGDPIYAIGNPGGVEFANSFTNGMVSAIDRPVNSSATGYTMDCIQHTAAINPGNSGGALVNSAGQVIGINSMKIVADDYEGMGFAVPSAVFVEIVNEIMKNGYVANRPKLGITYVPASEYENYGMFVALKEMPSGSIVIYEISADSSLAGSAAKAGDMIIAVNGTALDDSSYLPELIEQSDVGDTITLSLVRIYEDYTYDEFDVTVTLVEDRGDVFLPEEEPSTQGGNNYEGDIDDYFEHFFEEYFGGNFNP